MRILSTRGKIYIVSASLKKLIFSVLPDLNEFIYPFEIKKSHILASTKNHIIAFEEKKKILQRKKIKPYLVAGDSISDIPMMKLAKVVLIIGKLKYDSKKQRIYRKL